MKMAFRTGYEGNEYDMEYNYNVAHVLRIELEVYEFLKECPMHITLSGIKDLRGLGRQFGDDLRYFNIYVSEIIDQLGIGCSETEGSCLVELLQSRYEDPKDIEVLKKFKDFGLENQSYAGFYTLFDLNYIPHLTDKTKEFLTGKFDAIMRDMALSFDAMSAEEGVFTFSDGVKIYFIDYQNQHEINDAFDSFIYGMREFYKKIKLGDESK